MFIEPSPHYHIGLSPLELFFHETSYGSFYNHFHNASSFLSMVPLMVRLSRFSFGSLLSTRDSFLSI